jgi:hypothetical protein
MRLLKFLLTLVLLTPLAAAAQTITFPGESTNNVFTGTNAFQGFTSINFWTYSVGTLPSPGATIPGLVVTVNDALTAGSCTSGGGSAISLCRNSGSAWVPLGGAGSLTSITFSSPLTGGAIVGSGTVGCPTCVISSGTLTANLPVLSVGGQSVITGTLTGNTMQLATWTGATTSARCVDTDSSGNLKVISADCGTVVSVTFTGDGTVLSSTPSSAVTGTGTLTAALATATAHTVLGNFTGSTAAPTYGSLTTAMLPFTYSGNTTQLVTTTGTLTNGDCVSIDGSGNFIDSGQSGCGGGGGGGTVTSVGGSFTGGLVSVGGSPVTTSGTLAFTVAGTSGGIPYFNTSSHWNSSGALTANMPVVGGGAGSAPTVGTVTGNTTQFATWTGATTASRCVDTDASGNLKVVGTDCLLTTGTIPINQVVSATGAITAIATGNNPLAFQSANSSSSQEIYEFTEATAATGTSTDLFYAHTIATSTANVFRIAQGAGANGANAPSFFSAVGGAGGLAATVTSAGKVGGTATLTAGAGSAGGATSGTGGAGGGITITAGAGGSATSGSTTGAGGDLTIAPGAAGTGAGTTSGRQGEMFIQCQTVGAALTTPCINITETWNTSGVVDAAILANITNTASGAGSKIMDLQVGGTSEFTVDVAGNVVANGNGTFAGNVDAGISLGAGTAPTACGSATGIWCATEASTAGTPTSGQDYIRANNATHSYVCSLNNGAETPCLPTLPSSWVSGHVISGGTWPLLADSGVVAANIVTSTTVTTNQMAYGTSAGVISGISAPATKGTYSCGYTLSIDAAAAPTCPLNGLTGRTLTGIGSISDTILYSDNGNVVDYEQVGVATVTLPTPTTLENSHFSFTISYGTGGAGSVILTPTTWNIRTGTAYVSTITLTTGQKCLVQVDPLGGNHWLATCSAFTVNLNFPAPVTGTTTSGGIPYFSNTTTLTSSGVLATNAVVAGGGAGGAPSTPSSALTVGTAITGVVNTANTGPGFVFNGVGNSIFSETNGFLAISNATAGGNGVYFAKTSTFGTNDSLVGVTPSASTGWAIVGATHTVGQTTAGLILYTADSVPISFRPNSTETVRFLSGGGIAIGSTPTLLISGTAPTVSSGFGTGASVTASNGTSAFRINVGTSNTGTGTIGMPTAANGWNCHITDLTNQGTNQMETLETGSSGTTSVVVQNYNSSGGLHAWVDSDVLAVSCFAY